MKQNFVFIILIIIAVIVIISLGVYFGTTKSTSSSDSKALTLSDLKVMGEGSGREPTLIPETPDNYVPTPSPPTTQIVTTIPDLSSGDTSLDIPRLLQDIATGVAVGIAIDIGLRVGIILTATVVSQVASRGLMSGLSVTGRLITKTSVEAAVKFLGVVSPRAAAYAIGMAANRTIESVAWSAANARVTQELGKLGVQSLDDIADVALRESIKKAGEEAGEKAAQSLSDDASKVAARAGATSAQKATSAAMANAIRAGGARAAAQQGARNVKLPKFSGTGAAGAVGSFLMVTAIVGLALDVSCCGGYCQVAGPEDYIEIRDKFKNEYINLYSNLGERLPIIFGPWDKKTKQEQLELYVDEVDKICTNPTNSQILSVSNDVIAKIRDGSIKTNQEFLDYVESRAPEVALQAEINSCTILDGKVVQEGSNVYCSYKDKDTCEASFKWPISEENGNELDTYVSWNSETGECNKDPIGFQMRLVCEAHGFPYDAENKTCIITREYCLQKGMDYDNAKKKCKLKEGQEACEMMFGTTMCRGLRQLLEEDQYKPCPGNSRPATEIAVLVGVGLGLATAAAAVFSFGTAAVVLGASTGLAAGAAGQSLCADDNACPSEQETINGLCYSTCNDEAKYKGKIGEWVDYWGVDDKTSVQGMCYKKCPGGTTPTSNYCFGRNQARVILPDTTTASCPEGYKRLGVGGPGDLCEPRSYNVGIGTDKECQKTARGLCHTKRPWRCGGSIREEIDGLCYNPCHPIGNGSIPCPAGTTNQGGWCVDSAGNRKTDYVHKPGMPYLCVLRGNTMTKGVYDIGVCRDTGRYPEGHPKAGQTFRYERIGGICSVPCDYYGENFGRTPTAGGINCEAGARESFSREPKGTQYRVFPRPREIPFGTTEDGSGCLKAPDT